jgi:hypothetical protein
MTIEEMRKLLPCKMLVKYMSVNEYCERYVTDIFNDGSCRYIATTQEKEFLNGDYYAINNSTSVKPIQQKTKRLATRKEWLKWAAKVTYELATGISDDVWVVFRHDNSIIPPATAGWNVSVDYTTDISWWWRSKLGDDGMSTEWEQFWIEE